MSPSRVDIESSLTGPSALYTHAVKASIRKITANGPAQNTRAARVSSGEHLMRMMEVVARMKYKTDTYQIRALIELANSMLDTDTIIILEYRYLRRELK